LYRTADDVVEAMKRGEISPGKALLLMASVEQDPGPSKPKKRVSKARTAMNTESDLASLADEIEAKEFGDDEGGLVDGDEHDVVREERDEDRESEDDGGELVDDGYRFDGKAGADGSAYNTGRYRYSSCFGGYNASGAEWCPDDDF
jgi:hypothetical protein